MSHVLQAYSDLLAKLTQLSSHPSDLSLPKIGNTPSEKIDILKICQAILIEGERHSSEIWSAHMTPASSSASLLGQVLAGLHNGNLLSPQLYPLLQKIEKQLLDWFCSLFHQQHGHFTAGATYANLEALWQAREQSANQTNIVYGSNASHYSLAKACQILGLKFQAIATDDRDRILPSALEQACQQQKPVAIVLNVGTSACGEIDPVNECVHICRKYESWCHIDAAWGGALVFVEEYKALFTKLAEADSISVDPHKAFGQPKPCGLLLYKKPRTELIDADASYLEHAPQQTLAGSYGGELFLPLWSSIMFDGVNKLRNHVQQRLFQAEQFAKLLKQHTDWWVSHTRTGIVCFQPTCNLTQLNDLLVRGIFSQAKVNGREVFRVVFASPNTKAKTLLTELEPFW